MKRKKTRRIPVRSTKLDKKKFVTYAAARYGIGAILSKSNIQSVVDDYQLPYPIWLTNNKSYRVGWGEYKLPLLVSHVNAIEQGEAEMNDNGFNATVTQFSDSLIESDDFVVDDVDSDSDDAYDAVDTQQESDVGRSTSTRPMYQHRALIPKVDPLYVPWGEYYDVEKVIRTNQFYNVFITGLSGNGKTTMVEQACANNNRECIRVNITYTTDEEDLFGGHRLFDNNTVWFDGPVITAMKAGSVLLLDEIDLSSAKIMCLQPILEGKAIFLKKTGELVQPAPGFTVIATANTKGRGSDDGKFMGTQILNEAFLDRFPATIEQSYPPSDVEKRILEVACQSLGISITDPVVVSTLHVLVAWAEKIRSRYHEGELNEVISTRRLVDIIRGYSIFGDMEAAILKSVSRFDEMTKDAFISFYQVHVRDEQNRVLAVERDEKNKAALNKLTSKVSGMLADINDIDRATPGTTIYQRN